MYAALCRAFTAESVSFLTLIFLDFIGRRNKKNQLSNKITLE